MGWVIKSIGNTCSLATGGTPSRAKPEYFENGGIKWLVSGDIHQKEIFDCNGRISELGLQNSNARYLPKNSVMIALNGQGKTRGSVSILRTEATCNQSLVSISPNNTDELLPEFLYINLHGRYEEIRKMTGDDGNDRRGLNMPLIRSILIPLPPIPEQQRIVAILDKAFADIEKARANAEKNLKNARELFDSYLQQVFTQRGEGWVEISVGDVLTLEYGKPLDKSVRKENGLYPAYGANGVKTRSDEYYCETPSIIVGRKGSAGELTFTEDKYWPLDVTYYVGFNSSNYDLHFLYYMLARLNLPSLATGVKPGINRNVVYGLRVSVPPLNVQKNVAKKLKNIAYETSKVEGVYKEKLNSLNELKKSLLQKAFSGELTKSKGIAA